MHRVAAAVAGLLAGPCLCLCLVVASARAEPSGGPGLVRLGSGWLTSNDGLGDLEDRWRTAALTRSVVTGRGWSGRLPAWPGRLWEYRLGIEAIAPANLAAPRRDDRRYAGILGFGLHGHFALDRAEIRLGGDLVAVGPQTGVAGLHDSLHAAFGLGGRDFDGHRLENAVHPTVSAEAGLPLALPGAALLRPFAEARAGDETLVRIGVDLALGAVPADALWLRDPVTGQRFVAIAGTGRRGAHGLFGADLAQVAGSAWMPKGGSVRAEDRRARLRAGLGWNGARFDAFYGLTWLSPEFSGQDEGQVLGSVTVRVRF